jgi:RNA polymerase sigma factor (sigma-70 family)
MTGLADEDDAAVVARCRRGEGAAWEALVHRYQRLVYAIVRRVGLDEHAAADVFQTVFARLVEHLPRIADPQRLQAWIVTTAKREALLALRRGRRTVSMTRADDAGDAGDAGDLMAEFDIADDAPLPEDALAELQQQDLVRRALDRMDARCRELLLMLFREDGDTLPYEDVAQRLGLAVGSIGPTRARCLAKLRGLVDPAAGKM